MYLSVRETIFVFLFLFSRRPLDVKDTKQKLPHNSLNSITSKSQGSLQKMIHLIATIEIFPGKMEEYLPIMKQVRRVNQEEHTQSQNTQHNTTQQQHT